MAFSTDPIVDSEQVNHLRSLFDDGFEEFITTYFNDFEEKDTVLVSAMKSKKIDQVLKIAHSLKGSSLNMGALGLANACYQIEMASRRGNYDEMVKEYAELKKIYPKTKEIFIQLI